ncbi:MAG: leucine-rich repeat protein [Bacteroidaceae bacterium]|nr:leucine-rich repeat protein [Bacteroidaceae bacterium]
MKKFMTLLAALLCVPMFMSATTYEHNWKFVTAGDASTYAIDEDGSLWGWGWNESGQLGISTSPNDRTATPQQISSEKWTMVASGKAYAFFLKEDGTLWAAGDNSKGVQGTGDGQAHKVLTQIGTDSDWKYVNTTRFFGYSAFAIKTDGTLWAWGEGEVCALGLGNFNNVSTPTQVGTDTNWKKVSVGAAHGMGLKEDGSLWMWGWNERGQLAEMTEGTGSQFIKKPQQYGTDTDWVDVFAVNYCSYAIKADGTLWAWGDNQDNLLFGYESTDTTSIYTPRQVTAINGKVTHISGCESTRIVAIGDNGVATKIFAWGSNNDGALGDGKGKAVDLGLDPISYEPVAVKLEKGLKFTHVASGQYYTAALTDEGRIYTWGKNRGGQLGNFVELNQMTYTTTPIIAAEKVEDGEGVFTFDAENIPSGLNAAKKLVLTGEWGTEDFQSLTAAIGNNSGFPPAGNKTIEEVDMSQATIAPETWLYVSQGTAMYGTFSGCRALTTVKMPAAEQAANFKSIRSAFQNCEKLTSIDLTGCVNVTNITDAFYGCASLTSIDLSKCELIEASESAFDKCVSMETIILPKTITLGKYFFGENTSLKIIDWSLFEGTEAPSYSAITFADMFQYVNDLSVITLKVPAAAYDLFKNDTNWSKLNIQSVDGVKMVTNDINEARDVYNFKGQYITTLKPGVVAADVLNNGLYIIGGKKMIIKK